jgi:hypothetical protein
MPSHCYKEAMERPLILVTDDGVGAEIAAAGTSCGRSGTS